jgi:hypothetical protein
VYIYIDFLAYNKPPSRGNQSRPQSPHRRPYVKASRRPSLPQKPVDESKEVHAVRGRLLFKINVPVGDDKSVALKVYQVMTSALSPSSRSLSQFQTQHDEPHTLVKDFAFQHSIRDHGIQNRLIAHVTKSMTQMSSVNSASVTSPSRSTVSTIPGNDSSALNIDVDPW